MLTVVHRQRVLRRRSHRVAIGGAALAGTGAVAGLAAGLVPLGPIGFAALVMLPIAVVLTGLPVALLTWLGRKAAAAAALPELPPARLLAD